MVPRRTPARDAHRSRPDTESMRAVHRPGRVGGGYVLIVCALVIAAQVTRNGRFYLVALLLTLPLGLFAVGGVYVAYGLVDQVVIAVQPRTTGDQIASWVFALTAPINVLLFAAAAIGNVLLVRELVRARRRRETPRPSTTP